MAIPSFTAGYPPDGSTLGQTKTIIRNNIDGEFQTVAVDHRTQNQTNPGYHTDIHMVPQGTWNSAARTGSPAGMAGFGQLVALNWTPAFAGATADTQLFNITGGGGVAQLTGNSAGIEGWSWMGGMLVQWGSNTSTTSGSFASGAAAGSVTFSTRTAQGIAFPTACYMVITVPFYGAGVPSAAASVAIQQTTISATSFAWKFNSLSSQYTGFYWIAVGQ